MKTIYFILLTTSFFLQAGEEIRVWTDNKGREIKATLMDKSETHADVLLKTGKRAKLKLSDLSQEDQEYVASADVLPSPEMTARTVKVDSNEARTKYDRRDVEVVLSDTRDRSYELTIHWLGPKGNSVAIYKTETRPIKAARKAWVLTTKVTSSDFLKTATTARHGCRRRPAKNLSSDSSKLT